MSFRGFLIAALAGVSAMVVFTPQDAEARYLRRRPVLRLGAGAVRVAAAGIRTRRARIARGQRVIGNGRIAAAVIRTRRTRIANGQPVIGRGRIVRAVFPQRAQRIANGQRVIGNGRIVQAVARHRSARIANGLRVVGNGRILAAGGRALGFSGHRFSHSQRYRRVRWAPVRRGGGGVFRR